MGHPFLFSKENKELVNKTVISMFTDSTYFFTHLLILIQCPKIHMLRKILQKLMVKAFQYRLIRQMAN